MFRKACAVTVIICVVSLFGCRKDPLKYTEKMAGDHTWVGTVTQYWTSPVTSFTDTMSAPIYVLNDKTIILKRSALDTLKLSLTEQTKSKLVFTASEWYGSGSFSYDTVVYEYKNKNLYYNSYSSGASHASQWNYQAR